MRGEYIASESAYSDMIAAAMSPHRGNLFQACSSISTHLRKLIQKLVFLLQRVRALNSIAADQRADLPSIAIGSFFALRPTVNWRHPGQLMSCSNAEIKGG